MSCLVEPLVSPLVGRGADVRARRTGLARSRLAASALMMTAVMAVGSTTAGDLIDRTDAVREAERVYRNPHKPPAPIPYHEVARVFGHVKVIHEPEKQGVRVARPGLAPRFEWDAIWASRLKHACDSSPGSGSVLTRGRRAARLSRSRSTTFLRFGSGLHRSGPSSPALA